MKLEFIIVLISSKRLDKSALWWMVMMADALLIPPAVLNRKDTSFCKKMFTTKIYIKAKFRLL